MDNDATGNKSDTKHKCQLRKHICAPKFEVKKMPDNSKRVTHHQLVSTSRLKFESNGGFTFSDTICFNRNIHYGRLIGVQIYERKIKKFYSIQNMRIIYGSWDILAKLMAYVGG